MSHFPHGTAVGRWPGHIWGRSAVQGSVSSVHIVMALVFIRWPSFSEYFVPSVCLLVLPSDYGFRRHQRPGSPWLACVDGVVLCCRCPDCANQRAAPMAFQAVMIHDVSHPSSWLSASWQSSSHGSASVPFSSHVRTRGKANATISHGYFVRSRLCSPTDDKSCLESSNAPATRFAAPIVADMAPSCTGPAPSQRGVRQPPPALTS